jgi:hypothetical protein
VRVEGITCGVDDVAMVGQFALDDYLDGPRPAVLVAHEALALTGT